MMVEELEELAVVVVAEVAVQVVEEVAAEVVVAAVALVEAEAGVVVGVVLAPIRGLRRRASCAVCRRPLPQCEANVRTH
jgi:F420-0:gamma-glutamyl ligase-like protein